MSETQLIEECLQAHNVYRTRHNAPPLQHDPELSRTAQLWADHIAASGQFAHSKNRKNTGENIAMKWSSDGALMSGVEATNDWYSEIKDYTFSGEENMNCGHFSQVVWVGSQTAGFGRSRASDGTVYVVGQYSPAGNFMGRWKENVLPPRDGRTDLLDAPAADGAAPPARTGGSGGAGGHGFGAGLSLGGQKFGVGVSLGGDGRGSGRGSARLQQLPAPPPQPTGGAQTLSAFEDEALRAHNVYRARHQAGPLTLDPQLKSTAQRWADEIARTGFFKHSSGRKNVGENIAMKWSSDSALMSGLEATNEWYSEIKDYTFSGEENMNCGHFSQLVWVDSRAVGFGRSQAPDGTVYVVAQYSPAGNYAGQWAPNVLPPHDGRADLLDEGTLALSAPPTVPPPAASGPLRGRSPAAGTEFQAESYQRFGAYDNTDAEVIQPLSIGKLNTQPPNVTAGQPQSLTPYEVFVRALLSAHNARRAQHATGALSLSAELSAMAQNWADELVRRDSFEHSLQRYNGSLLGENIACKWLTPEEARGEQGGDPAAVERCAEELVAAWYSEEAKYDYSGQSKALNAGHFTQVVWASTRELGVGRALVETTSERGAKELRSLVVCMYFPPGNVLNRFAENVLPPREN